MFNISPRWVRFLAKGVGIVGGILAIFFGALGLISLSASCIIAVLIQMYDLFLAIFIVFRVCGFLIIALEAPFCCMFIDFIERIAQFSEGRSYWQKAGLYGG